jgi:hypothetical protein
MRKTFLLFVSLTLSFGYAQAPDKSSADPQAKTDPSAKKQKKSAKRDQAKTKSHSAGDQGAVPGQQFPTPPEKTAPRGPRTPPVAPANPNSPDPTKPTTTKPIK